MTSTIEQSMVNGLTADLAAKASTASLAADTAAIDARLDVLEAKNIVFTKAFESAEQVITAAGALVIPHGLAVEPKIIELLLINKTAEFNYVIGDKVRFAPGTTSTAALNNLGTSVVADATNVNVRYGANASSIQLINKLNGNSVEITNANWRLIVRAYA